MGTRRKYTIDESVFKTIDTEAKAYWLGFIYADGNVSRDRRYLTIGLARKDREHLTKAFSFLGSNQPIRDYTRPKGKWYKRRTYIAILSVYSKDICADLAKQGCAPAKTFSVRFPTVHQVPPHLTRHFIRGYFDGDGSIYIPARFSPLISFVGTYSMMRGISNQIDAVVGASKRTVRHDKSIRQIGYHGKALCKQVADYMYKDATVYLDRKKEVIDRLMSLPVKMMKGKDHCMAKTFVFWDRFENKVVRITNLRHFVNEANKVTRRYDYASLVLLNQGKRLTHKNLVRYTGQDTPPASSLQA